MRLLLLVAIAVVCLERSSAQPLCDFLGVDSLVVEIVDDTVHIWNLSLCGNCSSEFAVSVSRSDDTLFIVQTDTVFLPELCDCLFDLRVSIVGLAAGSYTGGVYRDFRLKFPWTSVKLVGTVHFVHGPPTTADYGWSTYQSGCLPTSIEGRLTEGPREFALLPNFPNPFNPTTIIRYTIAHAAFATLKVYNPLGEEVAMLVNGQHVAGNFTATWDASGLPSGVYFYRLTAGEYVQTRKMVLMR